MKLQLFLHHTECCTAGSQATIRQFETRPRSFSFKSNAIRKRNNSFPCGSSSTAMTTAICKGHMKQRFRMSRTHHLQREISLLIQSVAVWPFANDKTFTPQKPQATELKTHGETLIPSGRMSSFNFKRLTSVIERTFQNKTSLVLSSS